MKQRKTTAIILRPKRQITLPGDICKQLGIQPGDILEVTVEEFCIVARPRKAVALNALEKYNGLSSTRALPGKSFRIRAGGSDKR